jgi:phosphoglucomutase
MMALFRESTPSEFGGVRLARTADYLTLLETEAGNTTRKPIRGIPGSDVLQFFLEDGSKITMRPSGTEPKIKFYFSVNARVAAEDLEGMKTTLRNRIDRFKSDLSAKINAV